MEWATLKSPTRSGHLLAVPSGLPPPLPQSLFSPSSPTSLGTLFPLPSTLTLPLPLIPKSVLLSHISPSFILSFFTLAFGVFLPRRSLSLLFFYSLSNLLIFPLFRCLCLFYLCPLFSPVPFITSPILIHSYSLLPLTLAHHFPPIISITQSYFLPLCLLTASDSRNKSVLKTVSQKSSREQSIRLYGEKRLDRESKETTEMRNRKERNGKARKNE